MATQAVKDAFESQNVNYELKFYIQDNSFNWVDFTDRAQWRGKNQLRKLGSMTYSTERLRGQLQQRLTSVTMDNRDGFWDRPLPASLQSSFDEDWNSISDTYASFSTSTGGKESIVFRHKAAVRINCIVTNYQIPVAQTLGVFLIEDLETNSEDGSATFSFAPMSLPLTEADASTVKEGMHWYQNSPANLLVERILQKVYADINGALPVGYDIEDIPNVRTPVPGPTGWAFSHLGRPPERTVNYEGTETVWQKDTRVCKAMCAWEYNTGTVTATAGSSVITGSGTAWSGTTSNNLLKINVGDAFIIRREYTSGDGGSHHDNDGYYYVVSVDSTTAITLNRPLSGTDTETGLKYSIVRLYMGIGYDLYEYNITTDTYRKLNNSSMTAANCDYSIERIWYNSADSEYPIWIASMANIDNEKWVAGTHDNNTVPDSVMIYRFKWLSGVPMVDYWGYLSNPSISNSFYRQAEYSHKNDNIYSYFVGNDVDFSTQGHISIPFEQEVKIINADTHSPLINFVSIGDAEWDTEIDTIYGTVGSYGYSSAVLKPDHWACAEEYITDLAHGSVYPYIIRFTAGQRGFLELNPYLGSKGKIVYCEIKFPDSDTDIDENTMTAWRKTQYYCVDLAQSPQPEGGVIASDPITVLNEYDTENGRTDNLLLTTYVPTAVTFDPSGNIYIALYREKQYADGTGLSGSHVAVPIQDTRIYRVESSLTACHCIYRTPIGDSLTTQEYDYCFTELLYTTNTAGTEEIFASRVSLQNIKLPAPDFPFQIVILPIPSTTAYDSHHLEYDDLHTGEVVHSVFWSLPEVVVKTTSEHPLVGLSRINIGTTASPDYRIAFFESGSGKLKYVDMLTSAAGSTITMTVSAFQNTDLYCMSPPVWISGALECWYISAPMGRHYTCAQSTGKYWLTKWSSNYSTRIELADFEGMNAWESISLISEICNAVYGFRCDGSFFFRSLPRHRGSTYTFTNDGGNHLLLHASKDRGQSEIVNKASFIPGISKMGDVEFNIQVVPTSKYGKNAGHVIETYQEDPYPRQVTLMCIQKGRIRKPGELYGRKDRARFKYQVIVKDIETILSSDYNGGIKLEPQDQMGILYNSYISVTKQVDGVDSTLHAYVGCDLKYSGSAIALSHADNSNTIERTILADDYWLYIRPYTYDPSWTLSNSISLDGLGRNIEQGDIILIGLISDHKTWEYVQVNEIDVSSDRIGVIRGVGDDVPPIGHSSGEILYLIRNTNKREVYLLAGTGQTASKGDVVKFDVPYGGVDSLGYYQTPSDPTSATPTSSIFEPWRNNYVKVGDARGAYRTGISLKFSTPTDDEGAPQTDADAIFSVGDVIKIKCPGLVLEQDGAMTQMAEDISSKKRWSLRESQSNGNKFMSVDQARWAVQKEVADNKEPHYIVNIQTAYIPWIDPLDIVSVQSRELFPKSDQFTEKFSISQMTFNPQERPTMSLVLRSVDPY